MVSAMIIKQIPIFIHFAISFLSNEDRKVGMEDTSNEANQCEFRATQIQLNDKTTQPLPLDFAASLI